MLGNMLKQMGMVHDIKIAIGKWNAHSKVVCLNIWALRSHIDIFPFRMKKETTAEIQHFHRAGGQRWPHLFGQTFLIHKWSLVNMAYAVMGSPGELPKYTPSVLP